MGTSVTAASPSSAGPATTQPVPSSRHPEIPTVDPDRFDPGMYRAEELSRVLADFSALPEKILKAARSGYEFRMEGLSREEGVLTPLTARRALFAFSRLPAEDQKYFSSLLDTFLTGDDTALVGRAILIKALAFNAFDRDVFTAFCNNLHAYDARGMLNATTLTEIDPGTDTDRYGKWGMRQRSSEGDPRANDGATQVFTTSCFATSTLLYKGEINPVYALSIHENGFDAASSANPWFQDQERILRGSSYWSARFNDPTWRINEVLIKEAEVIPLFREMFENGTFDPVRYEVILERVVYFALGMKGGETLLERAEEELARFRAQAIMTPSGDPLDGIWEAIASRTRPDPKSRYQNLSLIDLVKPDEGAFLKLLARQGFSERSGWGFDDLFDYEQFSMRGTQIFDQFTPQNTGDDFVWPWFTRLSQDRDLIAGLLAAGQDMLIGLEEPIHHVMLATDVRLRNGDLELYKADPLDGSGVWVRFDDMPPSTEFYFPGSSKGLKPGNDWKRRAYRQPDGSKIP